MSDERLARIRGVGPGAAVVTSQGELHHAAILELPQAEACSLVSSGRAEFLNAAGEPVPFGPVGAPADALV